MPFDYDSFASELRPSELVLYPPSDVTELVRCYDETLTGRTSEKGFFVSVRTSAND